VIVEGRTWGAPNPITATSLHLLKHKFQKRFLAQQCTSLTNCLTDALAATATAAPVRENPYIIDRPKPRGSLAHDEARWEEALFWQWKDPGPGRAAPWQRLLTYQVNLPNKQAADDWGEIDLLGVSTQQLPVIVELKAPRSAESPAQMLIQATAYAVALQKAWATCFRHEWDRSVTHGAVLLPEELRRCELVCAAPSEYWERWTGDTSRARAVKPAAWAAFGDLRNALESNGFPSIFLRLGHEGKDPSGLPIGVTVEEEHFHRALD
jgi:hypothetical protein